MLGYQIVLEDVEEQLLLSEDFEPIGLSIRAVLLAQLIDEILSFFVQSVDFIFREGRGYQEEFGDLATGFDDSVDILRRKFLLAEVIKNCD